MTHTPGPWKASRDTDTRGTEGWRIDSGSVSLIAWLANGYNDMNDEIEANAHLIDASPDLLEACERALELYETQIWDTEDLWPAAWKREAEKLEALISKARGETQ